MLKKACLKILLYKILFIHIKYNLRNHWRYETFKKRIVILFAIEMFFCLLQFFYFVAF